MTAKAHAQRLNLDMRKRWLWRIIDGKRTLGTWGKFTINCSGCTETSDGYNVNGYPYDSKNHCLIGGGCYECGYTGKRRVTFFCPYSENQNA